MMIINPTAGSKNGTAPDTAETTQVEQLLDFYAFLIQANGMVARADDIHKLYDDICRLGIQLDRRLVLAWVGMIEPGGGEIHVNAHAGPAAGYLADIGDLIIPSDIRVLGPTGLALSEGYCVVVNRFLEDPATAPWHDLARQFGIAACAAIPLRRAGEVCGALMLYANAVDVFEEHITSELEVLSQTLSYAIDTARQRERERRQTERWMALLRLAQTGEYDGEHGEHDFLGRALEQAQRLTGSRVGFLHLVNEDQQTCDLVAWTDAALDSVCLDQERSYPISRTGIWIDSFHERRGLIVNDYPLLARQAENAGKTASHMQLTRLITVPVIDNDRVRAIAWVGDKAEPYDQDDLEFLQILATDAWRIVRRRRTEADLRDALRVVEASPVVCFRLRAEAGWPVEYVSQNVSRWGWQAADLMAGQPVFVDLVHPDDLPGVLEKAERVSAAGELEYAQEFRLQAADGRYFWVENSTQVLRDSNGVVRFYEGVIADIDADKRREQNLAESLEAQVALNRKLENTQNQLLQSEKMASIGQLAAGVAHEINNPIGFVNSNLGTLGGYVGDLLRLADFAATVPDGLSLATRIDLDFLRNDIPLLMAESKDGLDRVRKIVQDLKDFSRVGEVHWMLADLHQGLDSTLNIAWNEIKYKCTLSKQYGALPKIYCLPSQLNQVFMNLLVNAAQAIENSGEIVIRTELAGDNAVRVIISDTGRGIAPENLNRLFEPFFTTKPVGKGTGLGLSLAWGIVARHQGRIEVTSEVGKGSTFTITLPIKPAEKVAPGTFPAAAVLGGVGGIGDGDIGAVSPAPTF